MNYIKISLNVGLGLVVALMTFFLYSMVNDPIQFERQKSDRYDKVIERLKDIRTAQLAYRDLRGSFAGDFDQLIHTLKFDSIPEVRIIGNPDDTAQTVIYDTIYYNMMDRVFPAKVVNPDSLRYIPYSGGDTFNISAGSITRNRVNISVFEVSAPETKFLKGLDPRFINRDFALRVGSMSEGNLSGNWE
ncbi:MAG: hypothetical protein EA412_11195 [Chitinophagaceae bacterium]|nr:MAG: hypothetical protein EA412_11195 [Chitinophagaceae bacterium]